MGRRTLILAVAGLVASAMLPAGASAAAPSQCPGDPIDTDKVITGGFASERQGSFVYLPFRVPSATTSVRVKYCFDQPEQPENPALRHTLDLGIYEPRDRGEDVWGIDEFRGWGGSGYRDATITPQGFSSEQQYEQDPREHVPGRTTRSFRPGAIPGGRWAVELGLAAIVPRSLGDTDDRVAYRVEIELKDDPAFADDPYEPARYRRSPATAERGWYAGDFHVHAEQSGDSTTTMRETFDYAFRPLDQGGAGLDFITLSDHNTDTAWSEIGRYQDDYPGKLVARSLEVTTYDGHANLHASAEQADYRAGPLYERRADGTLDRERGTRPPRRFLAATKRAGGFTQINHPTIFPSSIPIFAYLCRGCSWEYSLEDTDYSKVDGVEIATGPPGIQGPTEIGPNPFTTTGIDFWEDKLARGFKLAALGSSDSHDAGEPNQATEAPIGTASTMVRADELSERGLRCAVEAGHTYVKVTGNDAPDLRFSGRSRGGDERKAIMGDAIRGDRAAFSVRVIDGAGSQLVVLKDNVPIQSAPVTSDQFSLSFNSSGSGRYRLQLQRASTIEAVSSPIYLDPRAEPETTSCDPQDRERDNRRFTHRHGPY